MCWCSVQRRDRFESGLSASECDACDFMLVFFVRNVMSCGTTIVQIQKRESIKPAADAEEVKLCNRIIRVLLITHDSVLINKAKYSCRNFRQKIIISV